MIYKKVLGLVGIALLMMSLYSCQSSNNDPQQYKSEINDWHQRRIDSLMQRDSWLSLAGLYWLKEGQNSFGSDSTNDIIFPKGKAPGKIGSFTLQDSTIDVSIASDVSVAHKNKQVQSMQLKTDAVGDPTILRYGSLHWYIIKRGNRYAVRLKDEKSSQLTKFDGINRYPVRKKWRVEATFIPFDSSRTMNIPTITGRPAPMAIPGKLTFNIESTEYTLLPTQGNEKEFFIVFGDQTNGDATYGGGRYLYVKKPQDSNTTYIDFNKAYNPPCVFTVYATCPLPPPENKLPTAIKAGEKMYGSNHH